MDTINIWLWVWDHESKACILKCFVAVAILVDRLKVANFVLWVTQLAIIIGCITRACLKLGILLL